MNERKELILQELNIGSYVCLEGKVVEVYGLRAHGNVQLLDGKNIKDRHISEVEGWKIDGEVLDVLGFEATSQKGVWLKCIEGIRLTVSVAMKYGETWCRRVAISGKTVCWSEELRCVHDLQRWWVEKVLLPYGIKLDIKLR